MSSALDFVDDVSAKSGFIDRLLLTLVAAVVVTTLSLLSDGLETAEAAPPPPAATTSRYMATVNYTTTYNEGVAQGQAGQSGIIVLDFGQPQYSNGFGTWLFNNTFASISSIEYAARGFLSGFFYNSPPNAYIRLAVGTNNNFGYTGSGHGQAWALMVNRLGAWISSPPSYASKETIKGASDMETGWSGRASTRAWADGYNSADQYAYYNYGDAGGCPPYGSCNGDWTQEDVYYVSWGVAPGYPLPEIYCNICYGGDTHGGNAAQWYQMSLYSYLNHGGRMTIQGSFTQWAAAGYCCTNSPGQGWSQLYDALNADSRTAQGLAHSTDITWATN